MTQPTPQADSTDCVIILHGLARSERSMAKLAKALEKCGYRVINTQYPSTKYRIEELAEMTIPNALKLSPQGATIHFVTHSLGGILVRQYLSKHALPMQNSVFLFEAEPSTLDDILTGVDQCSHQIDDDVRLYPLLNPNQIWAAGQQANRFEGIYTPTVKKQEKPNQSLIARLFRLKNKAV